MFVATLKDEVLGQIIKAVNFEEMKARAIEIILRNEAKGTQPPGIEETGQVEDGEVHRRDCPIHGEINCSLSFLPCALWGVAP
jgi:hypothetical protein